MRFQTTVHKQCKLFGAFIIIPPLKLGHLSEGCHEILKKYTENDEKHLVFD